MPRRLVSSASFGSFAPFLRRLAGSLAAACALAAALAAQKGGEPEEEKAAAEKAAAAKAEAAKEKEREKAEARTGPIRFTAFPVPDAPPLDVAAATASGVEALLELQEGEDGDQWPYEGVYRERDAGKDGPQLPVGYRVGGTSIVCLALVAAPEYAKDEARVAAVGRGVAFVLQALELPRMDRDFIGTYDVRGWGQIYALQLFLVLADRGLVPAAHAEAVLTKTKALVQALAESAIPKAGGWNYSRRAGYRSPKNGASPFMTAPALQALFHAKARGFEVEDGVLDEALAALERARSQPGGYAYSAPAESQNDAADEQLHMMDKLPGSAARAAAVETTLLLAGCGDAARHRVAVLRFFEHWDELALRKSQTGTHVPPYGVAPYYFLFGHLYAAQAIELLADEKERVALRERMRAYLARSRDADGSWNDRHFGRSAGYGTACALLALQMPTSPKPVARPVAKDAKGAGAAAEPKR